MLLGVGGGWLIADLATKRFAAARLAERSLDLLELKGVIVRLVLAHNPAGAWSEPVSRAGARTVMSNAGAAVTCFTVPVSVNALAPMPSLTFCRVTSFAALS